MKSQSELNDKNSNIAFFKEYVKEFVDKRNWNKYHNPNNLAQAITIEAAELLELFLFRDITKKDILENKRLKTRISEEISDIFIYLISLVNNLELDLTTIFLDKMNKNSVKYPLNKFNSGKYEKV
jgi:NTP pyrophosphatase (non-canonical NTP hydrolase)